jgi:hypothetical protein
VSYRQSIVPTVWNDAFSVYVRNNNYYKKKRYPKKS